MSNATAIDPEARGLAYTEVFGPDGAHAGWRRRMTPRQARRYWHKLNRTWGGYEPVDEDTPAPERPKGHPTPRRPDAVRGRLALRRFAEAHRPVAVRPVPRPSAGAARSGPQAVTPDASHRRKVSSGRRAVRSAAGTVGDYSRLWTGSSGPRDRRGAGTGATTGGPA